MLMYQSYLVKTNHNCTNTVPNEFQITSLKDKL